MHGPFTRREFVRGLGLVGLSSTVPGFLTRTARAMADDSGGRRRRADAQQDKALPGPVDARVLVVLQLAGGNDGLNTIIPVRNDVYYRMRRKLAVPARQALKLTDEFGLHPAAKGLKELYDDGLLGVIHGVGYPNPNRSHFVSTDIWETADPNQRTFTGWVGRYFDSCCAGADPPDPKLGIALTKEAPLTMTGAKFSPVSFVSPDQLQFQPHHTNKGAREVFSHLNDEPHAPAQGKTLRTLDFLRREAFDARMNVDDIREAAGRGGVGPRASLSAHLTMVANMIAAGLPTRVYYVSLTGFDTHSGQEGRHQGLLAQLGDGLSAFYKALKSTGHQDRVLVMTFSEFGRRVEENASGGTDHGAAAPMLLVGPSIKPGLLGRHPSLSDLDAGDLKHTTDFRAVYATVLENWLGVDAGKLIPGASATLGLLKA
ncbi:MAG: DUF1501 domain-containing protein [Phycisphaerae bacterium]|nr:MAG: DUF1501 domain-containing protein [Planctomycetota bacterium]KAB2947613.1 MAG: DUF1501 domain-containing protein [Phycisphaerae bacterium]MBE7455719.1 DUF1501 domain-containing protein [Planctomycetia bacterium]MCK6463355.1 DUF1501 domain-containing protein [Phycisphaerae bacterium]MCL4716977.1 DUF1501 domain-containing protein [Phycisphaerae bacterium]